MYFPGGDFGTWDADRIAAHETSQGRMREAILVSVDNNGSERIREYTPPDDAVVTNPSQMGLADKYTQFLRYNVMPFVRARYRILDRVSGAPHAPQVIVAGSSMGGLVSTYLGVVYPGAFGNPGVFSPAFWAAPNFAARRDLVPWLGLRWFLSIGTAETSSGANADVYWNDAQRAFNAWLADGYAHGTELLFRAGCGQSHNEAAWSRLLPEYFAFCLSANDEPNGLLLRDVRPAVRVLAIRPVEERATLGVVTLQGAYGLLERAGTLAPGGAWTSVTSVGATNPLGATSDAWMDQTVEDEGVPAGGAFWRVRQP